MSSFHIIPWYFLLLGVELPVYFSDFFFSQQLIDRGSYIINPVGNGDFSSEARCDTAKLKRDEVLMMVTIMQIMKEVSRH